VIVHEQKNRRTDTERNNTELFGKIELLIHINLDTEINVIAIASHQLIRRSKTFFIFKFDSIVRSQINQ